MDGAERSIYSFGLAASVIGHILIAVLMLTTFSIPKDYNSGIVYSITLEGGAKLGGMAQVATTSKDTPVAPPKNVTGGEEVKDLQTKQTKEDTPKEKDAEISLAEKEKEKEKEKVQPTPKVEPTKVATKQVEKEAPVKNDKDSKKASKTKEAPPADVNKDYQKALQRYMGESSEAGGQGFGAAKIGGKGMGGGVVMPPEFFTYRQVLRNKVKSGWTWYNTAAALNTWVTFEIALDGTVSNVAVVESSGNREYDESVLRALYKASPLPPPPTSVYQYFKAVKMSFDPRE